MTIHVDAQSRCFFLKSKAKLYEIPMRVTTAALKPCQYEETALLLEKYYLGTTQNGPALTAMYTIEAEAQKKLFLM